MTEAAGALPVTGCHTQGEGVEQKKPRPAAFDLRERGIGMAWSRFSKTGQERKMGNTKVSLDGHSFGSKLEAAVYQLLKLRSAAGEIKSIQVQDHVYLTLARIGYVADFRCELSDGSTLWVEAKGYENDRWPMKKKLWKFYGPGPLEIWKGSYTRPYLDETVFPKREGDIKK